MRPLETLKFLALLCLLLSSNALADQGLRPTAQDIASMSTAGSVTLAPDGSRLAYTLTTRTFDPEAEPVEGDHDAGWTVDRQLYVVNRGGGEPIRFTSGEERAGSPRFSPDGKRLAFIRKHEGKATIHLISTDGGEARQLLTGALEPQQIEWSSDGARIAFLAERPLSEEEKTAKWASGGTIEVDEEWWPSLLYVVPSAGGESRPITDGTMHIVDFAWSPDDSRFLAGTAVSSDPYYAYGLISPRVLSAKDGAIVRTLEPEPGAVGAMGWSPDGRFVAYEFGDGTLSLLNALRVHEVEGKASWNASRRLDPTLSGFFWSADSSALYAHVIDKTDSRIYRLSRDGQRTDDLGTPGRVLSGKLSPDRTRSAFACISSTPSEPRDPTVITLPEIEASVPVRVNPQVAEWTIGSQEVVSWPGPEGGTIEGLLFNTPISSGDGPPPLMVLPHGGPDSVTTASFSSWSHYFAARGFSVLRPNYRGGLGYGFDFYAANRGRLGEIEFMDIEAGVDHLIAAEKVDAARLVYGGWSWGGYLTAWTLGHTDRYRAAVAGAAVVDTVNQYVMSDINHGVAAEWEYTTLPWSNFERFDAANPMRFLINASTPTLVIHGQSDRRVPYGQGRTLYRALKDGSCRVKMLAYPREPHGFKEPAHTRHFLEAWADWYEVHANPEKELASD